MASLAAPLADAAVSMFAISTYDTHYVLVHSGDVERAAHVLRSAGHRGHNWPSRRTVRRGVVIEVDYALTFDILTCRVS